MTPTPAQLGDVVQQNRYCLNCHQKESQRSTSQELNTNGKRKSIKGPSVAKPVLRRENRLAAAQCACAGLQRRGMGRCGDPQREAPGAPPAGPKLTLPPPLLLPVAPAPRALGPGLRGPWPTPGPRQPRLPFPEQTHCTEPERLCPTSPQVTGDAPSQQTHCDMLYFSHLRA